MKVAAKKTKLIFGSVLLLAAALVLITWFAWSKSSMTPSHVATTESSTPPTKDSGQTQPTLTIGDSNAKVTLVEYGDFKCPLCGRFYRETEPQLKKDYINTGKLKIEFRPLPVIAGDSKFAAQAAYCSADQSKFPQFHDALFDYIYKNHYSKSLKDESSNIFTQELLSNIASQQGLIMQDFSQCLSSQKYGSLVESSLTNAQKMGITGTPTFMIGTQKISGAQPFSIFKPLIEAQLR